MKTFDFQQLENAKRAPIIGRQRSPRKASGAGFDAASKALEPGAQPGVDAQLAALMPKLPATPGPQMPTLPATPAPARPDAATPTTPKERVTPARVQARVAQELTQAKVAAKVQQIYATRGSEMAYARAIPKHELSALVLYTSPAYGPMNAVLRGLETDPLEVAVWSVINGYAAAALSKAKAPTNEELSGDLDLGSEEDKDHQDEVAWKGKSKKKRMAAKLDPAVRKRRAAQRRHRKRIRKLKKIPRVYRTLTLSDAYAPIFKTYARGATLQDPAFMSASTKQTHFGASTITWRIKDPQGGAKIRDLSLAPSEEEVLLPPGQRLKIDHIDLYWKHYPHIIDKRFNKVADIDGPRRQPVTSVVDRFPKDDKSHHAYNDTTSKAWIIDLSLETPAPAEAADEAARDD